MSLTFKQKSRAPSNISIKPELCSPGIWYAITINPIDDGSSPNDYVMAYKSKINKIFSAYFSLYPEISKLGRLHFHGIVKIRNKAKFFAEVIPELMIFAQVDIDTIGDLEEWIMYCTKNSDMAKELQIMKNINNFSFMKS